MMLNYEENREETKEERKNRGAIYETTYWKGEPDKGWTLVIFDKSGGVRSRLKLDEKSGRQLRDSLNKYLGETGA